jgi:hypothetical protein
MPTKEWEQPQYRQPSKDTVVLSKTGETLKRQNGRRELDAGKIDGIPAKPKEETRTEKARNSRKRSKKIKLERNSEQPRERKRSRTINVPSKKEPFKEQGHPIPTRTPKNVKDGSGQNCNTQH